MRCAAAGAVAVGGVLAFPRLNNYLQDERLFAQIPAQDNGVFVQMDRYLEVFPQGRHAAAVQEMRDDRRFTKAQRDAQQRKAPGSLRAYLADPANQRHRGDAQVLIAEFYDKAIADLKSKRQQDPDKVDAALSDAIVALLEALKRADRPVVTVGFKATLDPRPAAEQHKKIEQAVYDVYLKKNQELKGIAQRQPDGSAILTCGEVFDPQQIARREAVILGRLRAAVQRGINADILTLEPVGKGQSPVMEVAYHIRADGSLGLYTGDAHTVKGLLRWYETQWRIVFHPPGTGAALVYELNSKPGKSLTYDAHDGDPDWAVYAVILYSGFYDMSARLIRGFGLDPGPPPNAFTFDAVARTKMEDDPFKEGR
jgi:hypothetical protein